MFVEFLIKKFIQNCSAKHDSHRCIMHLLLSGLLTIFVIRSLYVKSQSIASTSNTKFWLALHTVSYFWASQPARTHHLGLKVQNFENPILTFRSFSLKVVYSSCKLQSFCLCTPLITLTQSFFRSTYLLKLSSS